MVERGDAIPSVAIKLVDADGISDTTADAVLSTGTVVFFSVPGAFTPTCHVNHLPGFLANAQKLAAAGVNRIVCASVNDHFVMKAWAENTQALGHIDFVADGNGDLATALGLDQDKSGANMGKRFQRAALVIRDGLVQSVFVEDGPGVSASGAPAVLMALESTHV
ncbi:peroxiredoxin [Devosia algicola]|uniref:Glutathione-dependent peroxiredoxin n=1 Tax=Devosia algicola TaxID=3026418 RepID=A0ABY7YMJ4_9HYPH|nr:peroxiredoxin [Devosia algicola]WDR02516.1 peroxiredoxin [Devosia algicola]